MIKRETNYSDDVNYDYLKLEQSSNDSMYNNPTILLKEIFYDHFLMQNHKDNIKINIVQRSRSQWST